MSPSNGDDPATQPPNKPPQSYWNAEEPFFDLKFSHWIEIFMSVALVVVGVSQLIVYYRQASIMRQQTQISAVQLTQQEVVERANIFLKDLAFRVEDNGNGLDAIIDGVWVNSGQTAASQLKVWSACYKRSEIGSPIRWNERKTASAFQAAYIGPGSSRTLGFCQASVGYAFPEKNLDPFIIYGGAEFLDAFKNFHVNEFCFNGYRWGKASGQVAFPPCQGQDANRNCADEDCPDWKSLHDALTRSRKSS